MEQKKSSTHRCQILEPSHTLTTDEDDKPPPMHIPGGSENSLKKAPPDDAEPPQRTQTKKVAQPLRYRNLCLFVNDIEKNIQRSDQLSRNAVKPVQPSLLSKTFCRTYFPIAGFSSWNDWHWQLSHRITCTSELGRFINLSPDEKKALCSQGRLIPMAITPYYLSLINRDDEAQPLRRTVIPVISELERSDYESFDPLAEEEDSPVPGLVHRYPDRVLFLATDFCSVYCRYCTRSRILNRHDESHRNISNWEHAIQYIRQNPQVRDVLISGGDPLTLEDDLLEKLISEIHRIPHVEIIRIGTKVPAVLPQRITMPLVRMLQKYHPLLMSIHFTHPDELTPEVQEACCRLANAGIPLGSQTVLLKGINDNAETMKRLFQGLLKIRVKPYYLYQCDPIVGSAHFRTSVKKGIEIIASLQGHTTGYAVPHYVIDAPGGGGKIPVNCDTVYRREGGYIILRNYRGHLFRYPDSVDGSENGDLL